MEVTKHTQPFEFLVAENFVPVGLALGAMNAVPAATSKGWVRYDNDFERRKWACNDFDVLAPPWAALFAHFASEAFVRWVAASLGLGPSRLRIDMHGAGCHVSFAGSVLQPHLDFSINPKTGLQRLANVILYLNQDWHDLWGGATEMCDMDGNAVARVRPAFNRAVIWRPGDDTVHGVEPMRADAPPRLTAACYFSGEPLAGCSPRRRAMFIPRR